MKRVREIFKHFSKISKDFKGLESALTVGPQGETAKSGTSQLNLEKVGAKGDVFRALRPGWPIERG